MIAVLRSSWALLLGVFLMMVGNGIQGTLLGVRGELEGFSTSSMSIVMSGYFAGFLVGSRVVPNLIRKVGHVRVFAALGSLLSAGLILFPLLTDPWSWTALRLLIGFCFCGVYIVSESWLNNATTNETRGQALSIYVIAIMLGIVMAQAIFAVGDPSGYMLFVITSVVVSIAFTPILLAATPVPPFETTKPMSLLDLWRVSPLGCVGIFLLGAAFAAIFGMAGVFGAIAELNASRIALFVSALYVGGIVFQYPLGWMSDRFDRRVLVVGGAVIGVLGCVVGFSEVGGFNGLLIAAFIVGGMANPLYALLVAYTNDYLDPEDMASASARLLFINGAGSVAGPLVTGWMMQRFGPPGFFLFIGITMAALALYAAYRMTQRPAYEGETGDYLPLTAGAVTPVTMDTVAEEWEEQAALDEEGPDSGPRAA